MTKFFSFENPIWRKIQDGMWVDKRSMLVAMCDIIRGLYYVIYLDKFVDSSDFSPSFGGYNFRLGRVTLKQKVYLES